MFTHTEAAYNDIINYLSNTLSSDAKIMLNHLLEIKSKFPHSEYVIERFSNEGMPSKFEKVDIIKAWNELSSFSTTFEITPTGAKITSIIDVFYKLQNKEDYTAALFEIFSEKELNNEYDDVLLFVKVRLSDLLLDSLTNTNSKTI